jgi:hypothetical protein
MANVTWICSCGHLSTPNPSEAFLHRSTHENSARDGGMGSSNHVVYPLTQDELEAREIAGPLTGIERRELEAGMGDITLEMMLESYARDMQDNQ